MNATEEIYTLRKNFSIIGLTGRTGSGCTKTAKLLNLNWQDFIENESAFLRQPYDILVEKDLFKSSLFKRKYSICYTFLSKNWKKYELIDYKKVLLLYLLNHYKNRENSNDKIFKAINKLFKKSKKLDADFEEATIDQKRLNQILKTKGFQECLDELRLIKSSLLAVKTKKNFERIHDVYFGKNFNKFCDDLLTLMSNVSYYQRSFFFHKLAGNIRNSGNPVSFKGQQTTKNIYHVAKLINRIIKSYKSQNPNSCHVVIDSLKNSLEIMFFKERYSAFHAIAIHNDDRHEERIKERIQHDDPNQINYIKLKELDKIEYECEDFKNGMFYSPDVQNCIQKAEIHIINENETFSPIENDAKYDFHSISEQLIRITALIQQPGIITPTAVERTMLIAYNSKFNSGCISRQVGAVVTDSSYSIKAVGWNDVPRGSMTCLLRNANEVIDSTTIPENDESYSEFEKSNYNYQYKLNESTVINKGVEIKGSLNGKYQNKNFSQNLKDTYSKIIVGTSLEGKNCSFCFKAMHNKFEGEKNQVHTRSLHAEENAMLQISKYGGQALKGGFLFTTASPCELCSKKAHQLGIEEIYYIDKYPGISRDHVLNHGFKKPKLKMFKGIIGRSFNKLYEPFLPYKDELGLYK